MHCAHVFMPGRTGRFVQVAHRPLSNASKRRARSYAIASGSLEGRARMAYQRTTRAGGMRGATSTSHTERQLLK